MALIYKHETHTFVWRCYTSTKRIVYASFGAAIQARNARGRLALIYKHEAASNPPSNLHRTIAFATTVSTPPPSPLPTSTLCHRHIHHLRRRCHSHLRRCIRPRHRRLHRFHTTRDPPILHHRYSADTVNSVCVSASQPTFGAVKPGPRYARSASRARSARFSSLRSRALRTRSARFSPARNTGPTLF